MRSNGFDEISQWAPSKLIGDNAKFDFGNWPAVNSPSSPFSERTPVTEEETNTDCQTFL